MTSDEFRTTFRDAGHLLKIIRSNGDLDMAVGLNGDRAVLHSKDEILLCNLTATPWGICELTAADHEAMAWDDRFE